MKQGRLFFNIAEAMQGMPENITQHQLQHLGRANPACGEGLAGALGLDVKLDATE